ncbi:MAG: nitrilase-related carbon-nitrogen hydrolase [Thermoanaerobacteraceae bacterium]|nr:nitrilase-related carbon-nitrogen hydrolase [Thermoanaerobacteraceae bacterium]
MGLYDIAAKAFLSFRFRSAPLKRYIERLGITGFDRHGRLIAAAAQVEFKLHKSPVEYFEHMRGLAEKAAIQGASIMAYPENIHLPLFGLIPGIEKQFAEESPDTGNDERASLMLLGPYVKNIYLEVFSSIAKLYGMYVMGGSITVPEDGELYNIAYLFGPDGSLIGTQRKLHLTPEEENIGVKAGDTLNVFELPFGRVALPVCMDATYYETFEIARMKGVDIVLLPISNLEDYEFYRALRGIWPRVQESRIIGIKSALAGKVAIFNFTGRAGIFAPIDLTPDGNGVINVSPNYLGDDVVVGEIDIDALRRYRENDALLKDRNEGLYRKYFSILYRD